MTYKRPHIRLVELRHALTPIRGPSAQVRWTILIIRDLLLKGPRKFLDFESSLPGLGTAALAGLALVFPLWRSNLC